MAGSNPNLKVRPDLAAGLRRSAGAHGLTIAALVAILVRNDALQPAQLVAVPAGRYTRERVACHMRATIRTLAGRGARRTRLSRNAYLEALVATFLEQPGPLLVLARPITAP